MDYEVRRLDAFELLGAAGSLEEIGALCDQTATRDGRVVYVAGVPTSDAQAAPAGFERFTVPGGRYALVHHHGPYSELAGIPAARRAALEAAGEQSTDRWLERYRPLGRNGETHVEIGVLLAEVAQP